MKCRSNKARSCDSCHLYKDQKHVGGAKHRPTAFNWQGRKEACVCVFDRERERKRERDVCSIQEGVTESE